MSKPRIEFSKLLSLGSLLIFVIILIKGCIMDMTQVYDTTLYVTAITVSGGIFGVCLKAYMSKSKAENVYKVQKEMYRDVMQIKLNYNTKMMRLSQKYNTTQADIQNTISSNESECPIDMEQNIINDMTENIDNHLSDTKIEDDVQNF